MANDLRPPAFVSASAASTPGRVFYVGNGPVQDGGVTASNFNSGLSKQEPFQTISQALSMCTDGRGDIIYVLPGHTHTLVSAGHITMSVADVQIIGLGTGTSRPTITFTTSAAASFDVTAANCVIRNIKFVCNIASQTAMVNLKTGSNDTLIDNCEFVHGTGTNHALVGILTDANATRSVIKNCTFWGLTTGTAGSVMVSGATAVNIVGGDRLVIDGCKFSGRWSATLGVIQVLTTLSSNLKIINCDLQNWTTSSTKVIVDTVTGSTGIVDNNRYTILSGTAPITGATLVWGLNYYAAAVATAMTAI